MHLSRAPLLGGVPSWRPSKIPAALHYLCLYMHIHHTCVFCYPSKMQKRDKNALTSASGRFEGPFPLLNLSRHPATYGSEEDTSVLHFAGKMLRGVSGQRVFGAPSQVRRVTCKKSAPVNAPMVRAVPGKVAVPATTAIAFAKPSSGDSGKSSRGDNVVVSASASNTESAAGCVNGGKALPVG